MISRRQWQLCPPGGPKEKIYCMLWERVLKIRPVQDSRCGALRSVRSLCIGAYSGGHWPWCRLSKWSKRRKEVCVLKDKIQHTNTLSYVNGSGHSHLIVRNELITSENFSRQNLNQYNNFGGGFNQFDNSVIL